MTPPSLLILCCSPGRPDRLDECWADEAAAASSAGLPSALIDHDAVVAGKLAKAVQRIPLRDSPTPAIYRGWMLSVAQYAALHAALASRGVVLINTPAHYAHAHHLPGWFDALAGHTPNSCWLPHAPPFQRAEIASILRGWSGPAIIKDYVKSEKHAWLEACFIPDVADLDHVQRVVDRFAELRGADFAGGLVFREFVRLKPCGAHPQSGMPLSNEWRVFWRGKTPLILSPYWDTPGEAAPDPAAFAHLTAEIDCEFFAMDLAQRDDGAWIVMEVGDGQVSGLPDRMAPSAFYLALMTR